MNAPAELARQQQALLAALFAWPPESAIKILANYEDSTRTNGQFHRGLQAYQANGHALAQRALLAAYPVLAQLLGGESFASLAKAFWHARPPSQGDLAQWGSGLAAFVESSRQLADVPYLGDVARVEWALHTCASCADLQADPASFALLMKQDPAALTLRLAPGCALLASAWPVASILLAHPSSPSNPSDGQAGSQTGLPKSHVLEAVGQMLRSGVAESAVVWRQGHLPRLRPAWPGEGALLDQLLTAQSLEAALSCAPQLDFNAWLPMAVQSGLLLGAIPLDSLNPSLQEAEP